MAERITRLDKARSRRLAATLGRFVAKQAHGGLPVKKARGGVRVDEVLVAVVSSEGAIVQRAEVRGRIVDLRELKLRLIGAGEAVEQLANEPQSTVPPLTAAEDALLAESGLPEWRADTPGALERTRIALELLLRESLTLPEAAALLHLKTTSRLRQRLAVRTLYGVRQGRSWRIPRFQLERGRLVRGIDLVLPHVRVDAHPVAVRQWFTSPHQDLVVGDDEDGPVTPLAWLEAGYPPGKVAELAEEI